MPTVIVWGPPCAGKSTFIDEHAKPGDVVLDLDRLALALSPAGTPHHDYPEHVRAVARAARLAVIDKLAAVGVTAQWTAWIIDSNASRRQLAAWRARGASVVVLDTDMATCLERAHAERPPEVVDRVAAWFKQHG